MNFDSFLLILFAYFQQQIEASVKQLGSVCDANALQSQCGRGARCYPVQRPSSNNNVGICLCAEGNAQRQPHPANPSGDSHLLVASSNETITSVISADLATYYTDCVPVARIGYRCTVGPLGVTSLDGSRGLILPDGAECEVKTSHVKCRVGTISDDHGKCVDSLGTRDHGERCGERIASLTSCDAGKRLACLPAHPYRRCQCHPGFIYKPTGTNSTTVDGKSSCVLVGIGERCENSFECNIAQHRAKHNLMTKAVSQQLSIAFCDAQTRSCRCDNDNGFLPVSYVVPNTNISVRRKDAAFEHVLMRVNNLENGRSGATPFITETRCLSSSLTSQISDCGGECSIDIDSASIHHKIAVCAPGLTCHYCPVIGRSQCVRIKSSFSQNGINELQVHVADEKNVQIDFCESIFSPRYTLLWLCGGIVLFILSTVVVSALGIVGLRKLRQRRMINRRLADDQGNFAKASMALLDASSSQVPQVWATFKITPWRT